MAPRSIIKRAKEHWNSVWAKRHSHKMLEVRTGHLTPLGLYFFIDELYMARNRWSARSLWAKIPKSAWLHWKFSCHWYQLWSVSLKCQLTACPERSLNSWGFLLSLWSLQSQSGLEHLRDDAGRCPGPFLSLSEKLLIIMRNEGMELIEWCNSVSELE